MTVIQSSCGKTVSQSFASIFIDPHECKGFGGVWVLVEGRGSRVEGTKSRVKGNMSRVEGAKSRVLRK